MQSWMKQNDKLIIKCAAAWICKNSKTHCTSSLCFFLLSLVSVFFMRKSKRRSAPEQEFWYQRTLKMFFYSSLYSFNTSKQWPTLVTCNHGIFSKPLHVGHYLLPTIHGTDLNAEPVEFTLLSCENSLCALCFQTNMYLKWYWLNSKSRFIMSVNQTKKSGQVVSSPIVQSCDTAYITRNKIFGFSCLWFSDFLCIGPFLKSAFFYCLQNHTMLS